MNMATTSRERMAACRSKWKGVRAYLGQSVLKSVYVDAAKNLDPTEPDGVVAFSRLEKANAQHSAAFRASAGAAEAATLNVYIGAALDHFNKAPVKDRVRAIAAYMRAFHAEQSQRDAVAGTATASIEAHKEPQAPDAARDGSPFDFNSLNEPDEVSS